MESKDYCGSHCAKNRCKGKDNPENGAKPLAIKIESVDGDINGEFRLDLSEKAQNSTQVKFVANLDAKGPFQWIVNQVIKFS